MELKLPASCTGRSKNVARGRRWVRRARRAHGEDRERGQQEGDRVVTLYVVVIHMSALRFATPHPKIVFSKDAFVELLLVVFR
jgi:hypothetical protein